MGFEPRVVDDALDDLRYHLTTTRSTAHELHQRLEQEPGDHQRWQAACQVVITQTQEIERILVRAMRDARQSPDWLLVDDVFDRLRQTAPPNT